MPTVLITGANRGIGLEFARQYAAAGWTVVATARQASPELSELGVRIESLDQSDPEAVASFGSKVAETLDLFIANAGTNHPMSPDSAKDVREWQMMMMINAIAPYQLGKALLPNMSEQEKMIAISSGMASIGDNGGGWVPYRTSKAALNMAWSSLALEARKHGVTVVALSPGWVKTRMGGPNAKITAEQSVRGMRKVFDAAGPKESGKFFDYTGKEYAW